MNNPDYEMFVSFEVAKLAKEKGFNMPCIAVWMQVEDEEDPFYRELPPNFAKFGDYSFPNKQFTELFNDFNSLSLQYGVEYISAPMRYQLIEWLEKKLNVLPNTESDDLHLLEYLNLLT